MSKESRKKAMFLLQKQDRTEVQLRDKLKQSGFADIDIDDGIQYVKDFHYLDDERFAQNYIRYGSQNKSRQKLKIALMQKGISAEVIERALMDEYCGDEAIQIRTFLERKGFCLETTSPEERQKMIASLYRKGFRIDDIKRVMGEVLESYIED